MRALRPKPRDRIHAQAAHLENTAETTLQKEENASAANVGSFQKIGTKALAGHVKKGVSQTLQACRCALLVTEVCLDQTIHRFVTV